METPIVKDRILLHLFDYRQFSSDPDVPLDMTQEGIAKAAWIDIRHVVQYVRPLIEEGRVRERSAHIQGGKRKRKVYDLTDQGRLAAYDLRKRLLRESIQVRGPEGIHERQLGEVLEEIGDKLTLLDIVRRAVQTGAVDLTGLEVTEPAAFIEMLADKPEVDEFLGRGNELEILTQDASLPRVAVVRGIAGIGKSTLAAQVCSQRRGQTNLYWHRIRSWDTPHSLLAGLGTFLAALGKPGVREVIAEGQADVAPQVLRETFPSIQALLVFDDIHDSSEDVVSFLRFMKDVTAESPKVRLLLLTRRAVRFYDRRDVTLNGLVQEIDLKGLESEDVSAVLPAGAEAGVLTDLGRHPLFLKLLRRAAGAKVPEGVLRDIHRFIEEAIYKDLTEPQRKVMKVASLYRVPVSADALFCHPALTHDDLVGLMDMALITRVGDEGLEAHDTIREFFSSVLTDVERRELGRFAVEKLNKHALEAREKGDFSLVVDYLSNAVELSPPSSEWPSVYEALGDAMEQIGDLAGALASYEKALGPGPPLGSEARIRRKRASIHVVRTDFSAALSEVERGFQAMGDALTPERGFLNLAACQVGFWTDEWEEAREHALSALEIFQTSPDLRGRAESLLFLAHAEAHLPSGQQELARDYLRRASDAADALGDKEFSQRVLGEMVYLKAYHLGQPDEALKHLARMESLLEGSPSSLKRVKFLSLMGSVDLHLLADYGGAKEAYKEILSLGGEFHTPFIIGVGNYGLAQVAFYQGRYEQAHDGFMRFVDASRERENLMGTAVEATCMAAWCSLLQGDLEGFGKAVSTLRSDSLKRGVQSRPLMTKVVQGLEEFTLGEGDRSVRTLGEALELSKKARIVGDPALPLLARSAVLRTQGKNSEADEDLRASHELLEASSLKAALATLSERHQLLARTLKSVGGV